MESVARTSAVGATSSSDVLFLVHRLPFPPDKGDKLRSYHLLRWLAGRYRVHLGALVDSAEEIEAAEPLRALCHDVCLINARPWRRFVRTAGACLRGEALTFPWFRSSRLAAWTRHVLRERRPSAVVAFSSSMAQYALRDRPNGTRLIVDFVDVDSEKWLQFARTRSWPWNGVYAREGRRLSAAEVAIARGADASVFVSAAETELFASRAPDLADRLATVGNGVDRDYFDPRLASRSPFPDDEACPLVFTGTMDYWPNVDAAAWFAHDVLPRVREHEPRALLWVVGCRPTPAVRRLEALPGVRVTGRVADVRPYLAHARLAVAPLRIGRGVQNKVLEALAMGRRVVATDAAVTGIVPRPGAVRAVPVDAGRVAAAVVDELAGGGPAATNGNARAFLAEHYDWERALAGFAPVIESR